MSITTARAAAVALVLLALAIAEAAEPAPTLNTRTYWYGNTWGYSEGGGGRGRWMQQDIADLTVAGGRIYAITPWDEHGGEAGIYTTGGDKFGVPEMDGDYPYQFHSWGFSGGTVVATDDGHVYYAVSQNGEGNAGQAYGGVSRYTRDGLAAGWEGAVNRNRLVLFPGTRTTPSGLAAHAGVLYVSDPVAGRIRCIATATMTENGGFACPAPGRLVVDATAAHDLWIIDTAAKRVRRFGRDGTERGIAIADCLAPVALCVDARSGDLLVADGDPGRQQIRRYRAADGAHVAGADFGAPITAGPVPGRVQPGRFLAISGIQTDAEGSLYVACRDYGAKLWKFDAERALAWVLQGTEFVTCADADPGDDGSLHSAGHRYRFDYGAAPGKGWSDAAITLDAVRCPDDPRVRNPFLAVRMLRLQGQRIMLGKTQMGSELFFWRFDGEIAIPAAMYWPGGSQDPEYPRAHPSGPFLWCDDDGDGRIQAQEYRAAPAGGSIPTVDDTGSIWLNLRDWEAARGSIARLAFRGLDQRGVPTWDVVPDRERPIPGDSGIRQLSKLSYDAANDRMYLGVYTQASPHPGGGWEQMDVGCELQRFDRWSTTPTLAWTRSLVPPEGLIGRVPKAWTFERDYAFIGSTWRQEQIAVDVIRLADGERVGRLLPTADIGSTTGWLDMNDGIQSHRRADGTYVICVEEVWMAKGILFQWRPAGAIPLTITVHPVPATVPPGANATFSVVATGDGALTYRWQRDEVDIPGATAATYSTPPVATADDGARFRVIVSDAAGSLASAAATLQVAAPTGGGASGDGSVESGAGGRRGCGLGSGFSLLLIVAAGVVWAFRPSGTARPGTRR